MSCSKKPRATQLLADPVTRALLGVAVIVCVGGPLVVRSEAFGVFVVGVAIACVGLMFSTLKQAEIRPTGFSFAKALQPKDEAFSPFAELQGPSLVQFATILSGDQERAYDWASEALCDAYVAWGAIADGDQRLYLLCKVVHRFLGYETLHLVRPARQPSVEPDDWYGEAAPLLSLAPRIRAVVLLRHFADIDERSIARIVDRKADEIRADLLTGEEQLHSAIVAVLP